MPSLSKSSDSKLRTCHHHIQDIFLGLILDYDFTVIEGHRDPSRQIYLFNQGRSKVRRGKHNSSPSLAIDAAPHITGRGIPWPKYGTKNYTKDLAHFYYFAGWVMDRAKQRKINMRWGGDWDRDNDLADQTFNDLVHFELILTGVTNGQIKV